MNSNKKLLIVDDSPQNIQVLINNLKDDYSLFPTKNGHDAIQLAIDKQPDLILLDIMMPGMDGYTVCKQLKANEVTRDIPVIFLTAKNSLDDEAEGLNIGAVDYITKPFHKPILLARIRTHIELKEKRDVLIQNLKLEKQLSEFMEDIERITHHDMKAPLNSIIIYPRLILNQQDNLTPKQISQIKKIISAGKKLLNMINLSLDLYKMEKGTYTLRPTCVNMLEIIDNIIQDNIDILQTKQLNIDIVINGNPITDETIFDVDGEELLFYSMLSNLIKNALEASPFNETICISLDNQQSVIITIHNKGAVPEHMIETFFDKYSTYGKEMGTGLGTYSARLIAKTMGGTLTMNSSEKNGTSLIITFHKQTSSEARQDVLNDDI
jgi:DNA-binding response OmpR family regulator